MLLALVVAAMGFVGGQDLGLDGILDLRQGDVPDFRPDASDFRQDDVPDFRQDDVPDFRQDDVPSAFLTAEHRGDNCLCMEYWTCINEGGQPYSYCGLDESSVCCVVSNSAISADSNQQKPQCGVKGFDSGVVGIAEPSEWPWHVAIVEEPGFFYVCGGSLVDEGWVLTAAHCVSSYRNNGTVRLKVRLGEHDVAASVEALPHEDRNVSSIIVHPNFDGSSLTSDIALLKLSSPARRRHHIDVVCLPENRPEVPTQTTCVLTGWGKTSQNSSYSQVLKEVPMPIWENRACESALQNEFGTRFRLPNNTLCAGGVGREACDGDGGGPLVCQQDGQWVQRGIVSFGLGCGGTGSPGIYTQVSHFQPWIRNTVLGVQ